jgi:glucose-1-phosphate thymidylyltransferase
VFGYRVDDPQRYGVIEFDDRGQVLAIEEKPRLAKSTGGYWNYFYDET